MRKLIAIALLLAACGDNLDGDEDHDAAAPIDGAELDGWWFPPAADAREAPDAETPPDAGSMPDADPGPWNCDLPCANVGWTCTADDHCECNDGLNPGEVCIGSCLQLCDGLELTCYDTGWRAGYCSCDDAHSSFPADVLYCKEPNP